ncbi:aldehyde dehydrogenase [Trametes meyenii]|nr:aldehyde dehydrogenase [Trametes meyenii]
MSFPFTPLYIDGKWRPSSTGATFDVRNPVSGEAVGTAARASQEDCVTAVQAAAQAFQTWELSSLSVRRNILMKASEILASKKEQIRHASREEVAQTEEWMWANYDRPLEALREIATMTAGLKGETATSIIPGGHAFTQRRAIGVVFSIAPWNAPIYLALRAVAVPIVCGNTVVLKTSEACPRVQSIIVEAFAEAGLPHGVLNCLSTGRDDAPARTAEIIANPAVRKINFTGSDTIGRLIAIEAAKYLKPCVLELGGKAAAVVRDFKALLSNHNLTGGMLGLGRCGYSTGGTGDRLRNPYKLRLFERVKAGVPHVDTVTHIGAVIGEASAQNAIDLIKNAVAKGAKLLVGDLRRQGAILEPHLIVNVKPNMPIWNRETFAPVAVLAVVDTVDEAVALANASEYTLTSSIWTKDVHKAFDVAARMRNGTININGSTLHSETLRENEGLGGKTGYGSFMIEDWTQLRLIVLHPEREPPYPVVARL